MNDEQRFPPGLKVILFVGVDKETTGHPAWGSALTLTNVSEEEQIGWLKFHLDELLKKRASLPRPD